MILFFATQTSNGFLKNNQMAFQWFSDRRRVNISPLKSHKEQQKTEKM